MLQLQDPYGIGLEVFGMRRIKPITIKLAEIDRDDNFVTSTKQWIKEIREEIKNGSDKKA